jgi:hypothetical protein
MNMIGWYNLPLVVFGNKFEILCVGVKLQI